MSTDANVATIRLALKAINERDLTVKPTLVTPGFVRHDLASAFREVEGREGVTDILQHRLATRWRSAPPTRIASKRAYSLRRGSFGT